jgi:hypothetical protein
MSMFLLMGCSSSKIITTFGDISINRVEYEKEFMGQSPKDYYTDKFLIIYFDNDDNLDSAHFEYASQFAVISDSYGNEYERAISGSQLEELFIAFVVPEWISNFTLNWLDNEPIQLEKP